MEKMSLTIGHLVSHCWWCNNKLVHRGTYGVVEDPVGNQHKVHKTCVKDAVLEGNKEVKTP